MASIFTPDGILLGAAEYGAYSAIARRIIVACITSVVLRAFFVSRIGIFLTAELSSSAGLRIFKANLAHPSNSTVVARLQVIALFVLAFFVTRLLDIVTSTFAASTLAQRSHRIAYVRTVDTSPNARPYLRTATIQRPYYRSDVYHALHEIVKGAFDGDQASQLWPRTIGVLTDAEVAAVTLTGSICSATDLGPRPGPRPSGTVPTTTITSFTVKRLSTRPMSLFGEDVEFVGMESNVSTAKGADLRFAIPVSISFLAPQDGQKHVAQQARRQFGILANYGPTLTAYDMECGLNTSQVDTWLQDKQQSNRKLTALDREFSSTLWYHDLFRVQKKEPVDEAEHGWTAALLMDVSKEGYNEGAMDILSFGSPLRGTFPRMTMSVMPFSNMMRTVDEKDMVFSSSAQVLPKVPALQKCEDTTVTSGRYSPGSNVSDPLSGPSNSWAETGPPKNLTTGMEQPARRCSMDLGPSPRLNNMPRIIQYFYDPANRGAQVCRTRLRLFSGDGTDQQGDGVDRGGFFDFITAARFERFQQRSSEVKCFPKGKPLAKVALPLASSSNGDWGFVVNHALTVFNTSTNHDPHGPQAWFLNIVVVPWVELALVGLASVAIFLLGQWDDLAEVVTIVMYSFSFRPKPPNLQAVSQLSTSHAKQSGQQILNNTQEHTPAHLKMGASGINLLQPITFAAVKYISHEQESDLGADVRLLPSGWNVQAGDNVSQYLRVHHSSNPASDPTTLSETVMATHGRVGHLVTLVDSTQGNP